MNDTNNTPAQFVNKDGSEFDFGFDETMSIYTRHGSKICYLDRNGYDYQTKNARKLGLKKGDVLTVVTVEVGDWSSLVYTEEYPSHGFNTVMFANVPPPNKRCTFQQDDPSISGDARCHVCFAKFHYDLVKERGLYKDANGVFRLECPNCLARNE